MSLFDPTDILQEVWKDFFSKRVHRQVFQAEVQLIRYLSGMARRITLELERRHYDTQKRDIRRNLPLERAVNSRDNKLIDWRLFREEPTQLGGHRIA